MKDESLTPEEVDDFLRSHKDEYNPLLWFQWNKMLSDKSGIDISSIKERLKQIRREKAKSVSQESELNGAIKWILEQPDLFEFLVENETDKKIVGEYDSRYAVFLCMQGRLVENAQATSYNLFVNSESGSGKDYIVSKMGELIPKEYFIRRTRISPTTFTYWHNSKYDPEWTWNMKICYLEDISENVFNHEVFKVMTSSGSLATVTINQQAYDIEIKGKPVMITTSASTHPNPEMLRRFSILTLDETVDQTKAIMKRQAENVSKGVSLEYDEAYIEAQKYLKPVKVKVPYAENLVSIFPTSHIIIRTHFPRFLDFIKASTAFYQYQREVDEEGFLIATGQDYDIARRALLKITSNKEMVPLTKDQRRLLEIIKKDFNQESFTIKEIEPKVTFISDRWLRAQLDLLAGNNFLIKEKKEVSFDDKDREYIAYKYLDFSLGEIPTWKELCRISSNTSIPSIPSKPSNPSPLNALNALNGDFEV